MDDSFNDPHDLVDGETRRICASCLVKLQVTSKEALPKHVDKAGKKMVKQGC